MELSTDNTPTNLESLPEPARTSTALEAVDMMRRVVALLMVRSGLNNLRYTKFELDNAPVYSLLAKRDKGGNVDLSVES